MVKRVAKNSVSEDDIDSQVLNENGKRAANVPNKEPKKRLKTKSLYRQPTANELNRLQETENLFNSNLFRLQVEEILQEVKVKEKTEKKFQEWYTEFKNHLLAIPENDTEYDLTESTLAKVLKVKIPIGNKLSKTKCMFRFYKFSDVRIVGSYAIGCAINSKLGVNVQITVPADTYTKNDSINYRYHKKRAAYLAFIASHIKKHESVEEVKYTCLNSSEIKPVLDVTPSGKLNKYLTVRIDLACEEEAYKLHRFSPARNNLREAWLFSEEGSDNNEIGPPTPYYNSSVLQDLTSSINEEFLKESLLDRENLKQAVVLLKIWLRQRNLQVSGHVISLLVSYLVQIKRINNIMSSYQIVRNVWIALKSSEWDVKGISLYKGEDTPSLEEFHQHFPVVFIDKTGYYNVCWQMCKGTYNALRRESELAVEILDNGKINSFLPLFMTPVKPLLQFDHILLFKDFQKLKESILSKVSRPVRLNYGVEELALVTDSLHALLAKGLGQRVKLILQMVEADFSWSVKTKLDKAREESYKEQLSFGLILDPENCLNIVEKGPPANLPEAEVFRAFWGAKSELRRFQDGSITEACVWDADSLAERRAVTAQIVDYLLNIKFGKTCLSASVFLPERSRAPSRNCVSSKTAPSRDAESLVVIAQIVDYLLNIKFGKTLVFQQACFIQNVLGRQVVAAALSRWLLSWDADSLRVDYLINIKFGKTLVFQQACFIQNVLGRQVGAASLPRWLPSWDADSLVVIAQIVDYLLNVKFDIKPSDLFHVGSALESLVSRKQYNAQTEEASVGVVQALDELRRDLRQLQQLPLDVSAVYGVSPVFSYCEPTPALPRAPLNKPWRRGNAALVKEIVRDDGTWVVPEYTPVCKAVIELGHSGKWPGDIQAFRCLKAAFNLQIADRLNKQYSLPTQAYPTHVDVLKNGLVFRLEIAHPKEITLLRKEMENGVAKFRESEESVRLQCETVLMPRLRGALHGLHQKHPAFGPSTCIFKRWLCCHLLSPPHFPPTLAELLVAAVFLHAHPLTPPTMPTVGLLRVLRLVAETDWAREMIVLDFNEDMKREEIMELESKFAAREPATPQIHIVTAYDGDLPSVWSASAPSPQVLARVRTLAVSTLKYFDAAMLSEMKDNALSAFVPSLAGYDVIIHLRSELVPYASERVEQPALLRPVGDVTDSEVIPVVEFNPVEKYLEELRSAYGDFALFFHDSYGGEVIAVLWKPDIADAREFQLLNANALKPVTSKGGTTYKVNVEALVEDFRILGEGLVKDIVVN